MKVKTPDNSSLAALYRAAQQIVDGTRAVFAKQGKDARELRLPILIHDSDMRITIEVGPRIAARNAIENARMQASGKSFLLVVANPEAHTGGMDEIRGESDQRGMDLGTEYDPNGDGNGMPGDVVDAEFRGLPDVPLQADLDQAEEDGYQAAADGKTQNECPVMRGELCIGWVKGWKRWHELNPDDADPVPTKVLGDAPNEHGVYTCAPDEVLRWELKKDWCDIELLELENGRWLHAIATHFGSGQSSEPMTCKDQTAASRLEAIRAAQSRLVQIYSKGENCGLKGKAFENFRAWVDSLLGEERTVAA